MNEVVRPIRGFNDILPDESARWRRVEEIASAVLGQAGYGEIRLPVLEQTSLFARSIGTSTDIVEKEMYTFEDRNGALLSLRPEGTAGCVRAGITHGLFNGAQHRLWYRGPMFRHERPQKGRYRQFHQIGAEAFGTPGPEAEAELIALSARLWRRLGIKRINLAVNSLGSFEDRERYREALVSYLQRHAEALDADSKRRLQTNPLRILDSKAERTREVLSHAPRITDFLGHDAGGHLSELRARLEALQIDHTVDPFLVRGLDYYTGTVFEWTTEVLGAQDAVCSGGRYDNLVAHLGGRATPAAGWALGTERLVLLVEAEDRLPSPAAPHAYFIAMGTEAERLAFVLAEQLRDRYCALRLILNFGGGSLKAQLRRADKAGAHLALIIGEAERKAGQVAVKSLVDDGGQDAVAVEALPAELERRLPEIVATVSAATL